MVRTVMGVNDEVLDTSPRRSIRTLCAAGAIATLGVLVTAHPAGATVDCEFSNVVAASPSCSVEVKSGELDPGGTVAAPAVSAPKVTDATSPSGQLPVTGGDAVSIAAVGAAMVGVGGILVARGRRTSDVA